MWLAMFCSLAIGVEEEDVEEEEAEEEVDEEVVRFPEAMFSSWSRNSSHTGPLLI
jgi:hypothetical protein